MQPHLLQARDNAVGFVNRLFVISSKASLNKRAAAIARIDAVRKNVEIVAISVCRTRELTARAVYTESCAAAAKVRDAALKDIRANYDEQSKEPEAGRKAGRAVAFDAAKERNDKLVAERDRRTKLLKDVYDDELAMLESDEDRQQAKSAFDQNTNATVEKCVRDLHRAGLIYGAEDKAVTEQFATVLGSLRFELAEATRIHEAPYQAAINEASEICGAEIIEARRVCNETIAKASDAHFQQLELIQAEYTAERKMRAAMLTASNTVVSVYFDWLNVLASASEKPTE